MMTKKIIIEVQYGSDWQEELQEKSLDILLGVWEFNMKRGHKKNKVKITRDYE